MKKPRHHRRPKLPAIAKAWDLPPGTKLEFEDVAEAMRRSVSALAAAVLENVKPFEIGVPEAMTAIATGSLGYAVNAYFRFFTAIGMPGDKLKEQLLETVEDLWRQTVESYVKQIQDTTQGEA